MPNISWFLECRAGRRTLNDRTMSITLEVPDSVARSLRLPEGEVADRLRCELAVALYGQAILPFGNPISIWRVCDP